VLPVDPTLTALLVSLLAVLGAPVTLVEVVGVVVVVVSAGWCALVVVVSAVVPSNSFTVPPGALLPLHPGLFTDTQADPVAETSPTGVSVPAETEVLCCADTGTGAEASIVWVVCPSVPPMRTPPLPVIPVSVVGEGSLAWPVDTVVSVVPVVEVPEISSPTVPVSALVLVVVDVVVVAVVVAVSDVWLSMVVVVPVVVPSNSLTLPPGALLPPHPGLLTDTQASPVAETSPTGVSAPAETDVLL